jgi:hypothetical protein
LIERDDIMPMTLAIKGAWLKIKKSEGAGSHTHD